MSINTDCSLRRLVTTHAWIMSEVLNACPNCTFENHPEVSHCEMCESNLSSVRFARLNGTYAFAEYYECDPGLVTVKILNKTNITQRGWNNLADQIQRDLTSKGRSDSTKFTGTFDEWKSHLDATHKRPPRRAHPKSREITSLETGPQDAYHEPTRGTACNDQDTKQRYWLSKCRGGKMGEEQYTEQQCKDMVKHDRSKETMDYVKFGRAVPELSWTVYTLRNYSHL